MFFDVLYALAGTVMYIISFLLGIVSWVLPTQITDAFVYMMSPVKLLYGVWPIADTLAALTAYLTFLGVWYTAKWIMKLWGFVPYLGKNQSIKSGK